MEGGCGKVVGPFNRRWVLRIREALLGRIEFGYFLFSDDLSSRSRISYTFHIVLSLPTLSTMHIKAESKSDFEFENRENRIAESHRCTRSQGMDGIRPI